MSDKNEDKSGANEDRNFEEIPEFTDEELKAAADLLRSEADALDLMDRAIDGEESKEEQPEPSAEASQEPKDDPKEDLVIRLWRSMRRLSGKPSDLDMLSLCPNGRPLADSMFRYSQLLASGLTFTGGRPRPVGADASPTRPATQHLRKKSEKEAEPAPEAEKPVEDKIPLTNAFGTVVGTSPEDTPTQVRSVVRKRVPKINEKATADQKKNFEEAWPEIRDRGISDVDALDEAIAGVHEAFPWMAAATQTVWEASRRHILEGGIGAHFPALLLVGPPGNGKTTWARALSDAFQDMSGVQIDCAASPSGFTLTGVEAGWSSANAGLVVQKILDDRISNPVVVLDELDKATAMTSNKGTSHGITTSLLGMMGPGAKVWACPFYQTAFDLRAVNWIATANNESHLSSPLLSRLRKIEVPGPDIEQVIGMVGRTCKSETPREMVIEEIRRIGLKGDHVTPRMAERMIEVALNAAAMPKRSS